MKKPNKSLLSLLLILAIALVSISSYLLFIKPKRDEKQRYKKKLKYILVISDKLDKEATAMLSGIYQNSNYQVWCIGSTFLGFSKEPDFKRGYYCVGLEDLSDPEKLVETIQALEKKKLIDTKAIKAILTPPRENLLYAAAHLRGKWKVPGQQTSDLEAFTAAERPALPLDAPLYRVDGMVIDGKLVRYKVAEFTLYSKENNALWSVGTCLDMTKNEDPSSKETIQVLVQQVRPFLKEKNYQQGGVTFFFEPEKSDTGYRQRLVLPWSDRLNVAIWKRSLGNQETASVQGFQGELHYYTHVAEHNQSIKERLWFGLKKMKEDSIEVLKDAPYVRSSELDIRKIGEEEIPILHAEDTLVLYFESKDAKALKAKMEAVREKLPFPIRTEYGLFPTKDPEEGNLVWEEMANNAFSAWVLDWIFGAPKKQKLVSSLWHNTKNYWTEFISFRQPRKLRKP